MTQPPLVVFRCDAGSRLGGGHVLRCMTLARGLERDGWRIAFAVGSETLGIVPGLGQAGWPVVVGFDAAAGEAEHLHAAFAAGAQLAVIDHYGRSAADEQALRPWARRLLVIDDLADRAHDCDVLLDTAFGRKATHYQNLVAPGTELLIGPAYALIREEFQSAAAQRATARLTTPTGAVQRVVLAFGMTDLRGITDRVAGIVLPLDSAISFDAIIGPSAQSLAALQVRARQEPRLKVHVAPPNVAEIMAGADMAVGAGGQMTFERCSLGLPSIGLSIADNQLGSLRAMARHGALVHLPTDPELEGSALARAFVELAGDPIQRQRMAAAAQAICDGQGVERVARQIGRLKN